MFDCRITPAYPCSLAPLLPTVRLCEAEPYLPWLQDASRLVDRPTVQWLVQNSGVPQFLRPASHPETCVKEKVVGTNYGNARSVNSQYMPQRLG